MLRIISMPSKICWCHITFYSKWLSIKARNQFRRPSQEQWLEREIQTHTDLWRSLNALDQISLPLLHTQPSLPHKVVVMTNFIYLCTCFIFISCWGSRVRQEGVSIKMREEKLHKTPWVPGGGGESRIKTYLVEYFSEGEFRSSDSEKLRKVWKNCP